MENTQPNRLRSKSTSRRAEDLPLYYRLFGRPAKAALRNAQRAAQRYGKGLARALGPQVPTREIEAFEEGHLLGQRHPDQVEALITSVRAGAEEEQQRRTASSKMASSRRADR